MELYIVDEREGAMASEETESWQEMLEQLALLALSEADYPPEDVEISLLLTNDVKIAEMNEQYRGIKGPTDVLSFAMNETVEGEEGFAFEDPVQVDVIGDIVISVETAMRQSDEYNHSLQREIGFLFVHGLLHLLGYDHQAEVDTALMRSLEHKVLDAYGLTRG